MRYRQQSYSFHWETFFCVDSGALDIIKFPPKIKIIQKKKKRKKHKIIGNKTFLMRKFLFDCFFSNQNENLLFCFEVSIKWFRFKFEICEILYFIEVAQIAQLFRWRIGYFCSFRIWLVGEMTSMYNFLQMNPILVSVFEFDAL